MIQAKNVSAGRDIAGHDIAGRDICYETADVDTEKFLELSEKIKKAVRKKNKEELSSLLNIAIDFSKNLAIQLITNILIK